MALRQCFAWLRFDTLFFFSCVCCTPCCFSFYFNWNIEFFRTENFFSYTFDSPQPRNDAGYMPRHEYRTIHLKNLTWSRSRMPFSLRPMIDSIIITVVSCTFATCDSWLRITAHGHIMVLWFDFYIVVSVRKEVCWEWTVAERCIFTCGHKIKYVLAFWEQCTWHSFCAKINYIGSSRSSRWRRHCRRPSARRTSIFSQMLDVNYRQQWERAHNNLLLVTCVSVFVF